MPPIVNVPDRAEIGDLIEEARVQKKNKANHVRAKIEERYPELKNKVIRRNGHAYNALDYMMLDLESHEGRQEDA